MSKPKTARRQAVAKKATKPAPNKAKPPRPAKKKDAADIDRADSEGMAQPQARAPGRAGHPLSSGGMTGEELLRKAMQTRPPEHDPEPPKAKVKKVAKPKGRKH